VITTFSFNVFLFTFSVSLIFSCFSARASDIEVTAKGPAYRNLDSQNSVSSFGPSDLRDRTHLEQQIDQIPNLTTTGGVSRPRFFQIRGIGERSSYEGMPNSSVGILIDDIDYTGFGGVLSLYGLSSLEVYRGPQSSSAGPSALAGMIYATTIDPQAAGLELSAARSNFNSNSFSLQAGTQQKNHGLSLVAQKNTSDGIYKNTFLNKEDSSSLDEETLRLKYKFITNDLNVTAALHYFNFDNGYDVFNFENSRITRSDNPGQDRQYTNGLSFNVERFFKKMVLKTIVSGHKTNTLYSYDEDWGNNPEWNQLTGWNQDYDYRIEFSKKIKTFSLEQKIDYQVGQTQLQAGLYFRNYRENFTEVGFNGDTERKNINGVFSRKNGAFYTKLETSLGDSLTLFSGLRVEAFRSNYSDSLQNRYSPDEELFGAELGLKSTQTAKGDFYLKLARGYKAGGINTAANVPLIRKRFNSESLYSLELGHSYNKSSTFSTKTTLFLMLRQDVQVKTSFQDNPSDPSSFTFYTDNATNGQSMGLEHEGRFQISPSYSLTFHSSLLKTQFGDYTYGSRNLKGREFAHAPEYEIRVTPTWNITKAWSLMSTLYSQDSFLFGNSHDQKAKSYQSIDLALAYTTTTTRVRLSMTNALDERRETRGFFFGNRPPSFNDERFVQVAQPRRVQLQIELKMF